MKSLEYQDQVMKAKAQCIRNIENNIADHISERNTLFVQSIKDTVNEGYKNIDNIFSKEHSLIHREMGNKYLSAISKFKNNGEESHMNRREEQNNDKKENYFRRKYFVFMTEDKNQADNIIEYGKGHFGYDTYCAKMEKNSEGFKFWILLEFKSKIVLNDNNALKALYNFTANSQEIYRDFIKKKKGEDF